MTSATDGYEAVLLLHRERPELIPLVRLIYDMGNEAFNAALDELEARGLLTVTNRFS